MQTIAYLTPLDRALRYAAAHTDSAGRMVVDGEIDTKDSGWLVLGAVIRGMEAGWDMPETDLKSCCRLWTLASVRVDDPRSAWTTFALLYALFLSGGTGGAYASLFSESEWREFSRFITSLNIRYLKEASKNYCVAAAFIETLQVRFGFKSSPEETPAAFIRSMLDAYLGHGFFNDDDSRGSRSDRRIDAYSAEIIGLLLHYDEIHNFQSEFHGEIIAILRDFCETAIHLIDADGEMAKWGRSLRGEAEIKKAFLWEFAARHGLFDRPLCESAARKLTGFFLSRGMGADGRIFRDKGGDRGTWDEYTTHVQAQGYGVYGLAFALRFATGCDTSAPLPSERQSEIRFIPGPDLICANDAATGIHYIVPLANRMTKNMYFWHNRITGENDVEVDVSTKFMPLPYFGHKIPTPYSGPEIPFLPMLKTPGGLLIPRNLEESNAPEIRENAVSVRQAFRFCRRNEYTPANELRMHVSLCCGTDSLHYEFEFEGTFPDASELVIYSFGTADEQIELTDHAQPVPRTGSTETGRSVYGPCIEPRTLHFSPCPRITYTRRWRHV